MQDSNSLINMDIFHELRDISKDLSQRVADRKELLARPISSDFKLVGAAIASIPWHLFAPYAQHK